MFYEAYYKGYQAAAVLLCKFTLLFWWSLLNFTYRVFASTRHETATQRLNFSPYYSVLFNFCSISWSHICILVTRVGNSSSFVEPLKITSKIEQSSERHYLSRRGPYVTITTREFEFILSAGCCCPSLRETNGATGRKRRKWKDWQIRSLGAGTNWRTRIVLWTRMRPRLFQRQYFCSETWLVLRRLSSLWKEMTSA